jgi:hypothetical protein
VAFSERSSVSATLSACQQECNDGGQGKEAAQEDASGGDTDDGDRRQGAWVRRSFGAHASSKGNKGCVGDVDETTARWNVTVVRRLKGGPNLRARKTDEIRRSKGRHCRPRLKEWRRNNIRTRQRVDRVNVQAFLYVYPRTVLTLSLLSLSPNFLEFHKGPFFIRTYDDRQ